MLKSLLHLYYSITEKLAVSGLKFIVSKKQYSQKHIVHY